MTLTTAAVRAPLDLAYFNADKVSKVSPDCERAKTRDCLFTLANTMNSSELTDGKNSCANCENTYLAYFAT